MGLWRRLFGSGAPDGFTGGLAPDEHVLASAAVGDGFLVASTLGLWLPGPRRVGWHLVSKASWSGTALTVVEAEEDGAAGQAVLLRDLPPQRFPLAEPGKVPEVVHARVTGSIRSREHRADVGAWFVQRKVPGRDGVVLQVRPDAGADAELVRRVAAEVAAKIAALRTVD
ncbi:hypothetical protein FHS29_004428 [Saccharothrix tamanrassetensis]|uniref:Uncharacterized protein n=1 Tax=Saccharothrix tamanrassetensis TaxID=1051531 RepID=A0A841CLL7_9PSEU|nr:hypothetical protein [Saccharothrix tamanrassetensis]MBB5957833.1 hypothetical protein [Saccharothrix tamanrassetensis]